MRHRYIIAMLAISLVTLALPAGAAVTAGTGNALVTRGKFVTLPGGVDLGYTISGTAVMIRTQANGGTTSVRVAVRGLEPNTTYKAHVHNGLCSDDPAGGGHYQNVVGGDVDAYNEIWPGFTTNSAGVGIGTATHEAWARGDARAVVIHWPDDSSVRLACVDLK